MKDILDIIHKVSNEIDNGRTVPSIGYAVSEEVGELSKEIRVKYMPDCYKDGDKDGILGEACDIVISTIDLMYVEGYTKEDIINTIIKKTTAWKNKATKSNNVLSNKTMDIINNINNHKLNVLRIYNYMLHNLKSTDFGLCETLYNNKHRFINHDDYLLRDDVIDTLDKLIPDKNDDMYVEKVIDAWNKVSVYDVENIKYYKKNSMEITDIIVLETIADLLDSYMTYDNALNNLSFEKYAKAVLNYYVDSNNRKKFEKLITIIQNDLDNYDISGFYELLYIAYS